MGGVRGRAARQKRTVKITGTATKKAKLQKGQKGDGNNPLTGLVKESLRKKEPLQKAYARLGVTDRLFEKKGKRPEPNLKDSERKELEVPEAASPRKKRASDLEYAWVLELTQRYDYDFKAMARDMKRNPMQYTAAQLRKRILRLVQVEADMFPDAYRQGLVEVPQVESGDEW
eukprot:Hpha_TRINITY_DN15029_c5_g19::TRINITY_DN15029_c5_g19_i1::g.125634::m.125634